METPKDPQLIVLFGSIAIEPNIAMFGSIAMDYISEIFLTWLTSGILHKKG